MKQRTWIALILGGTVVLNGVAYGIFRAGHPPAPPPAAEPPRVVASLPAPTPAPPVTPPPAATPPPVAETPTAAAPPVPEDEGNSGLARAHRASGLAALEDRDYDTAVADFTEAMRLRKDKGDLPELLRIAEELRSRGQARTTRTGSSRESAAPSRAPLKSRTGRLAARSPVREEPVPEPEGTRSGLLLVTSTPPGLVVLVDGKTRDLTPARLSLAVGSYRVALAHGERRLVEETVEVKEDAVQSLNRDVTADLTPAPPPPVAASRPPPEPVAAAPASPPSVSETPAPSGGVASAAVAQAEPAVARIPAIGDLDVASPALYGEVWINNRPYGFPPVSARGLPAGPARVEVRVNGEVKRRMTVKVEPGRSTAVRVR